MYQIKISEGLDGVEVMDLVMDLPDKYRKQYDDFFSAYELINIQPNELEKVRLKKPSERQCRFCKKAYPEVRFNKNAHVIPELLGRSNLYSDFECDSCNMRFGVYESEFSAFIGAARSLAQVKAKEGIPKYKSADKKLMIHSSDDGSGTRRLTVESEDFEARIVFDEDEKKVTLKTDRPSYVPLMVYKALAKILLTLLDEESFASYGRLNEAIADVNEEKGLLKGNPFAMAFIYVNPGKPFPIAQAFVAQKKDKKAVIPSHSMVLYFQNYIYQMFPACCSDDFWMYDGKAQIGLLNAPPLVDKSFVQRFGEPEAFRVMLGAAQRVKNEKSEIVLRYDSIIKVMEGDTGGQKSTGSDPSAV